ncbi:hypothetical protein TYRP_010016 [Tyrophagus putrescentiae]|nr:hypothetical protein TYRP_010016 [Tyrophagus putrescentiae]
MPVDDKPIRRGSKAKGKGEDDEDWMTENLAEDAVRAQKIENVNIAIQFLKNEEKVRIVNIDSIDVVDGKMKLICGVMWMLILHYSISMPMWEGEDESMYKEKGGPTPKQRLLNWIQNKVPDVPVNNFTTDWNNGIALGALVDSCAPGLCPDWDKWKPADGLKNVTAALKIAEESLGVAPLVNPEEMVNPKVDELSMMTFLAQFPNAKLKTGAQTKPRHNPKRVRCYGPGVQKTGVANGAKTNFTVETFSAGDGEVTVFLKDPSGKEIPVDVKFNDDDAKTYTCTYTPKMEGPHKVIVKYSGTEVPKSPFEVEVKGNPGDPSKVKCEGPGLKPTGTQVGKQTHFDIDTTNAGLGQVEVQITDPKGKTNSVPLRVRQDGDDPKKYRCEYEPQLQGPHTVSVNYAGKPVPNSPFKTTVAPPCDPRKVRALGRGLQPTGVRVEKCNVLKAKDGTTFNCDYKPLKEGKYVVEVAYGGSEIFQSPFEVAVGPVKESKVVVYGPGLKGGMVGYPAKFTVDTNGETGTLGFSVEGPSYAKIECKDNGDGSAEVTYHPTAPGEYAVHVTADFKPELVEATGPGLNPKGVVIAKPTEFTIKLYGPGLEKGVKPNKETHFVVDARSAGSGEFVPTVKDEKGSDIPVSVTDHQNGQYTVEYTPPGPGKYKVNATYAGKQVPKLPVDINVTPPCGRVQVAMVNSVQTFRVRIGDACNHFDEVSVIIDPPSGSLLPAITPTPGGFVVRYTAHETGTYHVRVLLNSCLITGAPFAVEVLPTPLLPPLISPSFDDYSRSELISALSMQSLNFQEEETLQQEDALQGYLSSLPSADELLAVQVRAFGPGLRDGLVANRVAEFIVDLKPVLTPSDGSGIVSGTIPFVSAATTTATGRVQVIVDGPTEAKIHCKDNQDHTCSVAYLPNLAGLYSVSVLYNGYHIYQSPFAVQVAEDWETSRGRSPVLKPTASFRHQFVSALNAFTVDARGTEKTGDGKVTATIKSPSGKKVNNFVENKNDGTYKVTYILPEEGEYSFDLKYDDSPVPGTPAKVKATQGFDPKRVKVYGPGIEQGFVNQPNEFTVETLGAGNGGLGLSIEGPTEAKVKCLDNRNGTCSVQYVPDEGGDYDISVRFGDQHVPGSPFKVPVKAEVDASKVTASGPGVDPNNCRAAEELTFKVDAKKSAKAPLDVQVSTDKGPIAEKPVIKDNGNGTYDVTYKPPPEGSPCNVKVTYGGKDIKGSTFQMKVKKKSEPGNVKLSGPGLGKEVPASLPTEFTVDTKNAGFGPLEVVIANPKGQPMRYWKTDYKDGTYKITYVPEDIGEHKVTVKFDGQEVAPPFTVNSVQTGDAAKCEIEGALKDKINANEEVSVKVTASGAGNGSLTCKVTRVYSKSESNETVTERTETLPSGATKIIRETRRETKTQTQREIQENINCQVVKNKDGTFSVKYKVKEPGDYTIELKYGGVPIKNGVLNFTVA